MKWLALVFFAACSFTHAAAARANPGTVAAEPVTEGSGLHRIQIPRFGTGVDDVWIYAASPAGPGPFPIVVYGHGQGARSLVNCSPEGPPDDDDARNSRAVADALAGEGYLAVSVFYRNRGSGIPAIGTVRPRDHFVLDARAMLGAARWARDRHGRGSSRVAMVGGSMGSFPTLWSTARLPELADLQDGLTMTTAVPMAMLGNLVANSSRNVELLDSADASVRARSIVLTIFGAISSRAVAAGLAELTPADLQGDIVGVVTPAGAELFRRSFLAAPDVSLQGCVVAGVPPACSDACLGSTLLALATEQNLLDFTATDWLSAEALEAFRYWSPPLAVDPGAGTSNTLLASWRRWSPAYAIDGPLLVPRLLPLVSLGDHVILDQVVGGNQAADQYLARLRATGASIPDPVPIIRDTSCGHDDYLDPNRPQCGYALLLAELDSAFDAPSLFGDGFEASKR